MVESENNLCPKCNSQNIEDIGSISFGTNILEINCICNDCSSEWESTYLWYENKIKVK